MNVSIINAINQITLTNNKINDNKNNYPKKSLRNSEMSFLPGCSIFFFFFFFFIFFFFFFLGSIGCSFSKVIENLRFGRYCY